MQVLDALNVAEQISYRYKEENTIKPINRDTFTVRMLSQDDYLAYKMNALLEVNDDKN